MGLVILSEEQVAATLARRLGLVGGPGSLGSVAGVAAMCRYVAEMECPCTTRRVVRRVEDMMKGLVEPADLEESVVDVLERVIGIGDLVQVAAAPSPGGSAQGEVALGPARFVEVTERTLLLLGLEPEGQTLLPESLVSRIEQRGELRLLTTVAGQREADVLGDAGYLRIDRATYINAPTPATAAQVVTEMEARLDTAPYAGPVQGIEVVLPTAPGGFYRGRWGAPGKASARTLGRRPQRFGSPLWCYLELVNGVPGRLLDLGTDRRRGCDEGWRLLMALDATQGRPQKYRVTPIAEGERVRLDVFMPLPQWCQRYMLLVANPQTRAAGALLSFALREDELPTVSGFLEAHCWMVRA